MALERNRAPGHLSSLVFNQASRSSPRSWSSGVSEKLQNQERKEGPFFQNKTSGSRIILAEADGDF